MTASRSLVATRTAADALSEADAAVRLLAAVRSATDSIDEADAAVRLQAIVRRAAESITETDDARRLLVLFRTVSDAIEQQDDARVLGRIWRDIVAALIEVRVWAAGLLDLTQFAGTIGAIDWDGTLVEQTKREASVIEYEPMEGEVVPR